VTVNLGASPTHHSSRRKAPPTPVAGAPAGPVAAIAGPMAELERWMLRLEMREYLSLRDESLRSEERTYQLVTVALPAAGALVAAIAAQLITQPYLVAVVLLIASAIGFLVCLGVLGFLNVHLIVDRQATRLSSQMRARVVRLGVTAADEFLALPIRTSRINARPTGAPWLMSYGAMSLPGLVLALVAATFAAAGILTANNVVGVSGDPDAWLPIALAVVDAGLAIGLVVSAWRTVKLRDSW
jgi:hypothetical protein